MGTCMVGWAHSRFGRFEGVELEALIGGVKGHPISATGVSMHVLPAMPLMGEAGKTQVPGAELAGVFNMGGSAVARCFRVLERAW